MAQLEADIAADPELQPPTTTAPEGASIEQVREGMHQEEPLVVDGHPREGEAQYAEGGSLAKELAKEKEEKEGEKAPQGT